MASSNCTLRTFCEKSVRKTTQLRMGKGQNKMRKYTVFRAGVNTLSKVSARF